MCRRRGLDEQTKDWGSKLKRTIKLQGYEGICAFLSQITTLKCLVCACSCRRVYKPQVGSWSLLISWEPAEWDSTHLQHPLYVSDWTCLLAKPQKKKKKPTSPQQPIFTNCIYATMISDWDYCNCTWALQTAHTVTWLCCSLHFNAFVKSRHGWLWGILACSGDP